MNSPDVTVVLPVEENSVLVQQTLDALEGAAVTVVLVLPAEPLRDEEAWRTHNCRPEMLRRAAPGNWPQAWNQGIQRANGPWVGLLEPGAVPEPGWPQRLVRELEERPEFSFAGGPVRLMYSPEVLASYGWALAAGGLPYPRGHRSKGGNRYRYAAEVVAAPVGGVFSTQMLRELGGFDSAFGDHYADVDLGWRAGVRGYRGLVSSVASIHYRDPRPLSDQGDRLSARTKSQLRLLLKNLPPACVVSHGPAVTKELWCTGARALHEGRFLAWCRGMFEGLYDFRQTLALRHAERIHARAGAAWLERVTRVACSERTQGIFPQDRDTEYGACLAGPEL